MTMSALPIWGFSSRDLEMRAALNAGWKRSDLVWERLTESGNRLLGEGRNGRAATRFCAARVIAALRMMRTDPRSATSLANMAIIAGLLGLSGLAGRYHRKALAIWEHAPEAVESMTVLPRARSSLFHLRMEARHWDTYQSNMKARLSKFIDESRDCLCAQARGDRPAHRLFSRWNGEKPSVFDDTRKILSACLLIASNDS